MCSLIFPPNPGPEHAAVAREMTRGTCPTLKGTSEPSLPVTPMTLCAAGLAYQACGPPQQQTNHPRQRPPAPQHEDHASAVKGNAARLRARKCPIMRASLLSRSQVSCIRKKTFSGLLAVRPRIIAPKQSLRHYCTSPFPVGSAGTCGAGEKSCSKYSQ